MENVGVKDAREGLKCKTQTRKRFLRRRLFFVFLRDKAERWGWWMHWRWHFDSGNFDLTEPRLSHESKCVSRALEMEGCSLWLWHPCEGLRLLGVKCDTSLGRCWFSAATAQQTSSHGVLGGEKGGREHRAPDREWRPNALHPQGHHLTSCKSRTFDRFPPPHLNFHLIFILLIKYQTFWLFLSWLK